MSEQQRTQAEADTKRAEPVRVRPGDLVWFEHESDDPGNPDFDKAGHARRVLAVTPKYCITTIDCGPGIIADLWDGFEGSEGELVKCDESVLVGDPMEHDRLNDLAQALQGLVYADDPKAPLGPMARAAVDELARELILAAGNRWGDGSMWDLFPGARRLVLSPADEDGPAPKVFMREHRDEPLGLDDERVPADMREYARREAERACSREV